MFCWTETWSALLSGLCWDALPLIQRWCSLMLTSVHRCFPLAEHSQWYTLLIWTVRSVNNLFSWGWGTCSCLEPAQGPVWVTRAHMHLLSLHIQLGQPPPSCKPLLTVLQKPLYMCVKWAAHCVGPCRGRRGGRSQTKTSDWGLNNGAGTQQPPDWGRGDTMGLFLQHHCRKSQHVSMLA